MLEIRDLMRMLGIVDEGTGREVLTRDYIHTSGD